MSRFGVIPKAHQPGKWCLITDLLHPQGHSINDGIPPHLCIYVTIDNVISNILQLGKGTMLAKIDIKVPSICSQCTQQIDTVLAIKWRGNINIDHCIPFGLRSAPKLFNILADLLSWITQTSGVSYLIHYLDNYLTMGPPLSSVCKINLEIFTRLCKDLRVPLASEKLILKLLRDNPRH